jgi:hypothetical protein
MQAHAASCQRRSGQSSCVEATTSALRSTLASRLVDRADPGTVAVDERFRAALTDAFAFEPLARRSLKGIDETPPGDSNPNRNHVACR